MKFAEHLGAHITPEWRKQYVNYEHLKEKLYEATEKAPSPEVTDAETISRYFARFSEDFFQFLDKELLKINTFYAEKIAEATRKFNSLQADLVASEGAHGEPEEKSGLRKRKGKTERDANKRSMHDVKLAFSEFYLSLILLQNYQTLNFTGFRKILKKHDKLISTTDGAHWRQTNVETAGFYTSKQVDQLIKDTELVFTTKLEGGDRGRAMKRLRVPPLNERQNPWTTFRVGLFAGIFSILIIVTSIAAYFTEEEHEDTWHAALRMYRGTFLVILCIFLLGINTYGWRASGVNHVLIFEIDPRNHLTHHELLELACFLAVIWGLSVISFLFSHFIYVPAFANPLCLIGFFIVYLFNPFKILHFKSRRWFLRILFRIFTAPFHHVGFADFWLADQLNSLATALLDFEYFICYYAREIEWLGDDRPHVCGGVSYGIRPIVACLPAWFRFAQCIRRYRDTRLVFPHIVNAGKYSTTFFVVLFSSLNTAYKHKHGDDVIQSNAFFYLWVVSAILSTCYTFTWDVKMDWGLMDKKHGFLREEIVYAHKGYYYFAMIEDFILRFAWTLTVSIGEGQYLHSEILKSIMAPLEVFRRFVWNFFRLENEHLNNCGNFRAVRDISIVPLTADDQHLLETMMDEEDGVNTRLKGKGGKKGDQKPLLPPSSSKKDTKIHIADDNDDDDYL